jgi:hypothetical protein
MSALDCLDLLGGVYAFELVEIGSCVEGGATDEVQGALGDFFPALRVAPDGAFVLADGVGCCRSERRCVRVDKLSGRPRVAPVVCFGVEFLVDRLLPGRLAGALCWENTECDERNIRFWLSSA